MSISKVYHTWAREIVQLRPEERKTRVENMAWLIAGIFENNTVQLSRIASKLPGQARLRSATRRLERFVDNGAIRVREWYSPIAREWLQRMVGHEYRPIVDGSKVGPWHQLLLVSLANRHRIRIKIMETKKRHSHQHQRNQGRIVQTFVIAQHTLMISKIRNQQHDLKSRARM